MKWSLFIALLLFGLNCQLTAQDIAAFKDQKGRFWVFEKGEMEQLHHHDVPYFRVNGDFLLYTDSRDEFHFYQNGEDKALQYFDGRNQYFTGKYLTVSTVANVLSVMRSGHMETLSLQREPFYVNGDSIVAFVDYDGVFKVYEGDGHRVKNDIKELEFFPIISAKAGDKTIAYVNNAQEFYYYIDGYSEMIEDDPPVSYQPGTDLVLYRDKFDEFKLYRDEEVVSLLSYPAESYQVGDEVAAYLSDMGAFYFIKEGSLEPEELSPVAPAFYEIIDNTMIYADEQAQFHVVYKGEDRVITGYLPDRYKFSEGVVAYLDHNGYLRAFYEGQDLQISELIVVSFEVMGRVILFTDGDGSTTIYHAGEYYYGY